MKRFLLLSLLFTVVFLHAQNQVAPKTLCATVENVQTVLTTEGVKVSWDYPLGIILAESFNAGTLPPGWKTIDADGDGYNWDATTGFVGHYGGLCISSSSYLPNMPLSPDNYLISPLLEGARMIEYWVSNQDYPCFEYYAVCASSTGNDIADFSIVYEEHTILKNLKNKEQGYWYKRSIQLPEGTKYAAFRHFNIYDQYWMNIDEVVIKNELAIISNKLVSSKHPDVVNKTYTKTEEEDLIGYKVYRDNELIAEIGDINTLQYVDALNNEKENRQYCVRAIYNHCESEPMCSTIDISWVSEMNGEKMNIYLNPVSSTLKIEGLSGEKTTIALYNAAGMRLFNKETTAQHTEIDFSEYAKGVYMIKIMDSKRIKPVKIVKK